MLILLDQDCVLADFDGRFLELWRELYPERVYVPREARTLFELTDEYPAEWEDDVRTVYSSEGFFLSLPPIAGALEAVKTMMELGHDVRICTSPVSRYEHCVREKYLWVERHFGREFVKRVILTKDKTLVRGDILIDDKPEIGGVLVPEWEHVVFDQPYNRAVTGKRRITWDNWQTILKTA